MTNTTILLLALRWRASGLACPSCAPTLLEYIKETFLGQLLRHSTNPWTSIMLLANYCACETVTYLMQYNFSKFGNGERCHPLPRRLNTTRNFVKTYRASCAVKVSITLIVTPYARTSIAGLTSFAQPLLLASHLSSSAQDIMSGCQAGP